VVVATARRAPLLQSVAQLARGLRGRIEPLVGDVADRAAMKAAVRRIEADFGPIALAFFRVGTFAADAADDFGADGFRQTFDINVMGTMNCLGPALQAMIGRGKGQIAINASIAGYGGLPRSAAYGASKAALINYAEGIYFALKLRGLNVQIVNPGFVRTPLTDNNTFPMSFLVTASRWYGSNPSTTTRQPIEKLTFSRRRQELKSGCLAKWRAGGAGAADGGDSIAVGGDSLKWSMGYASESHVQARRSVVAEITFECDNPKAGTSGDLAERAKRAFDEFARKHTMYPLVNGEVWVKFDAVK
jgi:NAD(P)-dependent dehydrogenase (short-subunit alcohol dehydrogenase family)